METTFTYLFLIGTLILGCIYCFRGYRSLRLFVGLYAFFAGSSWMRQLLLRNAPDLGTMWTWLLAIAVGIILALLVFKFIRFAVFLAGGLMGIAIFRMVSSFNPVYFSTLNSGMNFLVGLIFFVVFGFLTLGIQRHLLIWGTAVWGAYTTTAAAGILLGVVIDPSTMAYAVSGNTLSAMEPASIFTKMPTFIPVVIMCILALAGIIHQYRHSPKRKLV